jgi:hypothetical protein
MLFQIWYSDGNDRSEHMRIKATDIEYVTEYLLENQFKPEYKDDISTEINSDEFAVIEWTPCGIEAQKNECFEAKNDEYSNIEDMCEECEGIYYSFTIEKVEKPNPEDFKFKTIYGTNDYVDLTNPEKPIKAPDWNPLLAQKWKEDPQKGCDHLMKLTLEGKIET